MNLIQTYLPIDRRLAFWFSGDDGRIAAGCAFRLQSAIKHLPETRTSDTGEHLALLKDLVDTAVPDPWVIHQSLSSLSLDFAHSHLVEQMSSEVRVDNTNQHLRHLPLSDPARQRYLAQAGSIFQELEAEFEYGRAMALQKNGHQEYSII